MRASRMGLSITMMMGLILFFADIGVAENNQNGGGIEEPIDYAYCVLECMKLCPGPDKLVCLPDCSNKCKKHSQSVGPNDSPTA
ncbi:hypothetical protein CASFOL_001286 [Castilleja foliolosa]|uniref:Plant thionin family protein n=1 Tax=Castilleja foliolosa TaxID=1961234 RepID=A0ABD3EM59_9LAMI